MARPSDFTPQIGDVICERLADGESLRDICAEESMPNRATVFRWLGKHVEFRDQYARAREEQAESLADEIIAISDDGTNDWMQRLGEDGQGIGWQLNGEHVQRSKLRVEARKWAASKLKPKKYGDKLAQEISGPDGDPLQNKLTVEFVTVPGKA